MQKDPNEKLLADQTTGFKHSAFDLSKMFVQDNIHDKKLDQDPKVSISLYELEKKQGGVTGLAQSLQSSKKTGIRGDQHDLDERTRLFGSNKIKVRQVKTVLELLMEPFEDRILQILIAAAVVSLICGVAQHGWNGLIEGVSILMSICIIVSVTATNNYIKEKQFQELQQKQDVTSAIVVRNSVTKTVSSEELVVGDVVVVETGKVVPADCVLFEAIEMTVNESTLTGETVSVNKQHVTPQNYSSNPSPFLLSSTLVETGKGLALVCAVGDHTCAGKANRALDIENEATPLQKKLETIADQIGMVGFWVAILTFLALVLRMVIEVSMDDEGEYFTMDNGVVILDAFIIAVTVVVVAVPEGLPLAVTISLAYSVSQMFKEHNLVRKLHASETMGGAHEICSDKTGTLTQNKMSVAALYLSGESIQGSTNLGLGSDANKEALVESVVYNCSAHLELENAQQVAKGNVTEVGLLTYLVGSNIKVQDYISKRSQEHFFEFQIPFSSERKKQTNAVRREDGSVRVYVKGAPEIVIQLCTMVLNKEGKTILMDGASKDNILTSVVKNYAQRTYRTLLVAYVDYSATEWTALSARHNGFQKEEDQLTVEKDLVLVGIFGLVDPLRPGIRAAVEQCHRSGINVRMCTGDNIDTAIAISKDAGIISEVDLLHNEDGYLCMTGKQFREAVGGLVTKVDSVTGAKTDSVGNKKAFRAVSKKLRVLARSSPEDKYLLVTGLKDEGKVVAVTGDGTNDAPALNRADVGFAMGITGTDVAKNASDIVLTDDNFCSVLTAVKYGRNIYDSVRKFLQFQITVNLVALFIVFSGAIIFADPPLTAVQMLWVNLIMDTFAALALATEPPSDALLARQPVSKFEKIVDQTMWRNVIGHSIYQILVLLCILFFGQSLFDLEFAADTPFYVDQEFISANPDLVLTEGEATNKTYLYTMLFQTFVFMQLFNQINARKLGAKDLNVFAGFFNNWMFIFIVVLTFVVQVAMVEWGGRAVRAVPLTMEENLICLAIGAGSLVWGVFIKLILPPHLFAKLAVNEKEMNDEEEKDNIVAVMRRSFRQSLNKSKGSTGLTAKAN